MIIPFTRVATRSMTPTNHQQESVSGGQLSPEPRLFALIIGINDYMHYDKLVGAVPDARAFSDYLTTSLNVPETRIKMLIDEEATRKEIIENLINISSLDTTAVGDPIVIFYAGYGGEALAPRVWEAGGPGSMTQMIIPQDSTNSPEIPGIPDRTIIGLLNKIAASKGNNITVIFDCCYSACDTRRPSTIRSVEISYGIPTDLDQSFLGSTKGASQISKGFLTSGLSSHILLAACGEKEFAAESNSRGQFTRALLTLLETLPVDALMYSDILRCMDRIAGQNPQVRGMHTNRYLFRTADPLKRPSFGVKSNGIEITLEAGASDGLTMGAIFEVHLDQTSIVQRRNPLGVLAITQTSPFSSTLAFPTGEKKFTVPRSAVAVQVRTGVKEDLRLFVPREDAILMALFHQSMTIRPSLNIIFVNNPSDANISFLMINGRATCDIVQGMYGFSHRFEGIDTAEGLFPILRDAAYFHSELNVHKMGDILGASRIIDLEFFQLGLSDQNYREISPISDNLNDNGVIDVVVSKSTNDIYGFKITNKTDEDLYTSIFFFNNTDFSIGAYYRTPVRAAHDSDLLLKKNGGSITIGYGSQAHGSSPLSFHLREGHDLDLGFLKIFLSKTNNDFSKISQTSPFVDPGPLKYYLSLEAPVSRPQIPPQKPDRKWRTIIIPMIQRRHPASGPSPGPTGTRADMAAERIRQPEQENQELKEHMEMNRLTIDGSEEELRRLRGGCCKADEVA